MVSAGGFGRDIDQPVHILVCFNHFCAYVKVVPAVESSLVIQFSTASSCKIRLIVHGMRMSYSTRLFHHGCKI